MANMSSLSPWRESERDLPDRITMVRATVLQRRARTCGVASAIAASMTLLRVEFPTVNHKRVYRLYSEAQLAVRKRKKLRRVACERGRIEGAPQAVVETLVRPST